MTTTIFFFFHNCIQKLVYDGSQVRDEFVETEYYKDLNSVDKHHHTVFYLVQSFLHSSNNIHTHSQVHFYMYSFLF
jgi:hypothetical protein